MWWSIGQINGDPLQHSTLHSSCQAVNACARHPYNPFSATLVLYLFLTCPYSTTRTPVAPGCLVLPLHYLNRETKNMKNGLCGIHPSKPGMLSAAFIHLSDLLYLDPWHLLSHAIFISQSYAIRHLENLLLMYQQHARKNISDHILQIVKAEKKVKHSQFKCYQRIIIAKCSQSCTECLTRVTIYT